MAFKTTVLVFFVMVSNCLCRPSDDNSVVSVYTTQPSNADNRTEHSIDVYSQIANNIAEKITTPVIKFFGFDTSNTSSTKAEPNVTMTKTTTEEYPDKLNEKLIDMTNTSNTIEENEEPSPNLEHFSPDYNLTHQKQNKPEKIIIYSTKTSKHDFDRKTHTNSLDSRLMKDEDDSDDSDEVINEPITKAISKLVKKRINVKQLKEHTTVKPKEPYNKSFFVYVLELVGSFFQLVSGAFESMIKPRFSK